MDVETQKRNILISFGVLAGLSIIIGFMKTWIWFSRTGRIIIDLPTISKLTFLTFASIAIALFLITIGVSVWWLIFYKRQYENVFPSNANVIQDLLKIFLIVSFVVKTIDMIHLLIRQTNIDIFFMDWERSRTGDANSVSVWRTYFVANEFNEIQTFRRINLTFQLFFVLFLLKVINFENLTCAQSQFHFVENELNCTEYNPTFRTAIGFLTFLGTALIQYILYLMIYQRFIENKILNFIDLCSVSNISMFILDENQHGYYIHGRSPHGITDVNMKEILMNFHREKSSMCGTRGLMNDSNEQVFIVRINRMFRRQYELLFRNYSNYLGPRKTRDDVEQYTNVLLQSYKNLNGFLCAFIDQSLPTHAYRIRNRFLFEKLFDYEFQEPTRRNFEEYIDNIFFIDSEQTFTKILFYCQESSLFIWNMITFLFVDYLAMNYVLAAVVTFLLNLIFVNLRDSFGRKNLAKKTLIPREFLI